MTIKRKENQKNQSFEVLEAGCLAGWLVGWLAGWLAGWLLACSNAPFLFSSYSKLIQIALLAAWLL